MRRLAHPPDNVWDEQPEQNDADERRVAVDVLLLLIFPEIQLDFRCLRYLALVKTILADV